MNRYERYALTQVLLNQVYPPNPNNKVFGSRALWELTNAGLFFAINRDKHKNSSNNKEQNRHEEKPVKKELTPEELEELERQRVEKLNKMKEFLNKKTFNPFIIIAQLFCKYIIGSILIYVKLVEKLSH